MNVLKHSTFNIVFFAMLLIALPAFAGPKLEFGDDKWLSIGAGARVHFFAQEDGAADGENWSKHFGLENMRLYVNGQFHKYLKIEFNTDCTNCLGDNSSGTMIVLDAIGKFEFNQYVNVWGAAGCLFCLERCGSRSGACRFGSAAPGSVSCELANFPLSKASNSC